MFSSGSGALLCWTFIDMINQHKTGLRSKIPYIYNWFWNKDMSPVPLQKAVYRDDFTVCCTMHDTFNRWDKKKNKTGVLNKKQRIWMHESHWKWLLLWLLNPLPPFSPLKQTKYRNVSLAVALIHMAGITTTFLLALLFQLSLSLPIPVTTAQFNTFRAFPTTLQFQSNSWLHP